jgi:hypothetical protein
MLGIGKAPQRYAHGALRSSNRLSEAQFLIIPEQMDQSVRKPRESRQHYNKPQFSTVRREEVAQQQAHQDVDRDENDQPVENVNFHKLRSSAQFHLALRAIGRYHNLPENINAWKNH